MLQIHKEQFIKFKEIHDKYMQDPKQYQKEFNEAGEDIMPIIRRWENNLCSKSEGSRYGKFSTNLSEKFWTEIRDVFPKIDYVGME